MIQRVFMIFLNVLFNNIYKFFFKKKWKKKERTHFFILHLSLNFKRVFFYITTIMKKLLSGLLLSITTYAGIAQCSGASTLTAGSGTISDGSGSNYYSNSQNCSWLIQPSSGGSITLDFTSFDTESGYDYVRVYDGNSAYSSLLGTYSGSSIPSSITSSGSSLYITFTTDGSVTREGFEIYYSSCSFLKPAITSSSTTYCNSDILLATILESGYTYQWYKDGNAVANSTGSSFFADGPGQYHVSKFDGVCISNSSPVNITSSLATYQISYNSSPICDGEAKELYVNYSSSLTYQWYLNGVAISGANSNTYNAVVAGDYSVEYTNLSSGCSVETASVPVSIIPSPTAPVISVSGSLELCSSTIPPILTSSVSPVVWNTSETTTSILGNAAGIYFATSSNGTCSVTSDTIVVVDGSPSSFILSDYDTVCSGSVIEVSSAGSADISDDFSVPYSTNWYSNTGSYTSSCQNSGRLFFEGSSYSTRELVSNPIDLSTGGQISFNLEVSSCEAIQSGEEIVLQISTNGGYTWTDLVTYPYWANDPAKDELYVLQPNSANSNAMIRWVQTSHDGSGYDTWSLDDVSISSNGNNNSVVYSWSPSNAFTTNSSQSTFLSVDSALSISLTVTDPSNGCSSTSSKTIGVNDNYLGLSLSPVSQSVCAGDEVVFYGSLTDNSRNVQYSWNSNGDVIDVDSITTYGNLNTTQGVDLVALDLTTGCSVTETSVIVVNQYPSDPVLTTTGVMCIDDTVTIQANSSVTWSNGAVGNSITVSSPGNYYAYSSSNSCISYSDTINITNQSPYANIQVGNPAICPGGVVELTGSVLGGVNISDDFSSLNTSNWSVNSGSLYPTCSYVSPGALYFYSSGDRELITNNINISSGAYVSFDIDMGDCESADSGEDVVLQISTDGGYNWTVLYTVNNYSGNSTHNLNIPASSNNSNVQLRWFQLSHSDEDYDTWSLDNVSIVSNSGVSNGSYSYSWSPSNLVENPSSDVTNSLPLNSSSAISLTVTDDSSGCQSTALKIIDVSNGSVSGNPQIVSSSDFVCSGGDVELQVHSNNTGTSTIVDDFSSLNTSNWSVNTGSLTSDCYSYNSGSLYFYDNNDRELVTNVLNLSLGADVSFDLQMGDCESADSGEDVVLQISNNGGYTWTDLYTVNYYSSSKTTYNVNIPASSNNSASKLRWYQLSHSDHGYDTWLIDNVEINVIEALNATDPYSYSWSPANAFQSGANGSLVTTNPIYNSSSFSVTLTDTVSNCSTSLLKIITLSNQDLLVDVTSVNETVCQGGNVQLTATVDGSAAGYGRYSYSWNPPSNLNDDTLYNPVVSNLASQTSFVVTVTDNSTNCQGAALKIITPSGAVTKPTISQTSNFLICNEHAYDLEWFIDGVLIPNETSQLLNLASTDYASGCYTVAYNGDTCAALSDCFNVMITSIDEELKHNNEFDVTLYPNPTSEKLNVSFNLGYMVDDADFKVYSISGLDVTGQVEVSDQFINSGMNIDVANLSPGIYLINIKTDSKESFETFIKR